MPLFEESQFASGATKNFHLGLAALLVVGIVVAVLFVVVGGGSDGSRPGRALLLPLAVVLCGTIAPMLILRLRIRVDDSHLRVQLWPAPPTTEIPREQIRSVYRTTVRPLRDFGGWGIKFKKGHRLYSWGGTNGVTIEYFHKGKDRKVTVTTERCDELVAALGA